MIRGSFSLAIMLMVTLFAGSALANSPWGYRPIVIDGGPTNINTAYSIDNLETAQIAYHHVDTAAPALWLKLDGKYGDKVTFRLGVPKIDRFGMVRPITALIGPGLPAPVKPFPFTLPSGYGAYFYDTKEQDLENYTEPYTGVESWRYAPVTVDFPTSGDYYLVCYIPDNLEGKLWITVGEKRQFRLSDLWTVPQDAVKIKYFFEATDTTGYGFWFTLLSAFLGVFIAIIAVSPE